MSDSRPTVEQLALLSEEAAVQRFLDGANGTALRRVMIAAAVVAVGAMVVFLFEQQYRLLLVPVLNLVALRGLALVLEREVLARHLSQLAIAALLLQYLLFLGYDLSFAARLESWEFLVPWVFLGFRFRGMEYVLLGGTVWTGALVRFLLSRFGGGPAVRADELITFSILLGACLAVSGAITRRRRRRFVAAWTRESSRQREQTRMRQELEYAHRIQLSMLPRGGPDVGWLDIASLSLPASEVGGDYYDYLPLGADRLAVVVGDVAGHGLACGLLLSGVRSCLHLLKEDMPPPAAVMEKLHRMVRDTTDRRLYITLLYALFDRGARRLTLSAAGHRPLLRWAAGSRRVEEVALPALPLGAMLGERRYEERSLDLAAGDVLLLYTDGLCEIANAAGDPYGEARLGQALARSAAAGRTARETRDTLLAEVWNFKGDAEQEDDLTMVVARVVELE